MFLSLTSILWRDQPEMKFLFWNHLNHSVCLCIFQCPMISDQWMGRSFHTYYSSYPLVGNYDAEFLPYIDLVCETHNFRTITDNMVSNFPHPKIFLFSDLCTTFSPRTCVFIRHVTTTLTISIKESDNMHSSENKNKISWINLLSKTFIYSRHFFHRSDKIFTENSFIFINLWTRGKYHYGYLLKAWSPI